MRASRGLKWENKMYKLKRFIDLFLFLFFPDLRFVAVLAYFSGHTFRMSFAAFLATILNFRSKGMPLKEKGK